MTENRLIDLSNGEKCWLMIGICVGAILMLIILYLCTYLPHITEVQKAMLIGFFTGGFLVWIIRKFEW